ncbi:hypothetical protein [Paraburkholderia sp. HD33-4]|uniref:hypothetical protein n=1 Tax=Paraburkholderia sp. HD33-4 TaxID=2883242 RepID=UPI001F2CD0E5|nr:hypothetical protein [Paraburkholderia sp. HD33-4]
MTTPLLIGPDQRRQLAALRKRANAHPVDMRGLSDRLKVPANKQAHRAQMTTQSVNLPADFLVTFSIETGHPVGTCRHLSMSVGKAGRVPSPEAVWSVATELGFTGALEHCTQWLETLQGHGDAVNIVQPLMNEGGHA